MRKNYLMLLFAVLFAVPAFGVCKHENYVVKDDVKGMLYSYYGSWTPGSAPAGSENENFYIGRVRPLKRFTNEATQVIQDNATQITRRKNRGLLWWCPINEGNGSWTSLPRYDFDSEVFSTWSYVTTHGNWTQGFLRQPGAFADVCHKNGVKTACVSTAAWAVTLTSNDGGHGQNYQALVNGGADKLLKLLRYYGIDGLGFNSEQEWGMRAGMKTLVQNCHNKKATYGLEDRLHFDFYQLSNALYATGGSGTDFSDFFPYANGFFLNYGWNSSLLNSSASAATSRGGNTFDVYAGMDMQGRNWAYWTALDVQDISIGIWGAHNKCMPYEGATEDGSTKEAIQNCYLRKCEQLFTGGTRNPVNNMTIDNTLCNGNASFFGVSKLMAAKSALSWQTNAYFPFISYMNLGNGKFFNNEGLTTYNDEWYNIGMQDHLPTWRWWITTSYMGRTTGEVPSDTHAGFTYEDAWFGGSCLKLTFDNAVAAGQFRYIQMYKTQFPIASADNYTIRVRYKVLKGSATMQYTTSKEGSENTVIPIAMGVMNSNTSGWQVIEKSLPANAKGGTLAQLGMRFTNVAAGTEILIGEVALVKDGVTYAPVAPVLSKAELYKITSRGIDFKVIWDCAIGGSSTSTGAVDIFPEAPLCLTKFGTKTNKDRYTKNIAVSTTNGHNFTSSTLQTGASSEPVYFDKRSEVITVNPGENATLTVEVYGYWMMGTVFVDWNKDNSFTSDEIVTRQMIGANNIQKTYTFTIPAGQAVGNYTLRFVMGWEHTDGCSVNGGDGNSIAQNGGCVADFTLNVKSRSGAPVKKSVTARNAWESIYNDEVDAWYFEIWAQQEGKEAQLVTTTTSWAAYAVEAPFDLNGNNTIRLGVRTVAPDGVTKSDIAWTTYETVPAVTIIEGIGVNKPVIKPNEEFTISFDDVNHSPANYFKILKPDGTLVSSKNNATEFTTTIAEKGLYDVEYQYVNARGSTVTETIRALVQVSGIEVGAVPAIYDLNANTPQSITSSSDAVFNLDYTGRQANGTSSRALRLREQGFGVMGADLNNLGVNLGATPFTIAFWFKPEQFIMADGGTNFLNIRNPADGWPASDWGYIWSQIGNDGSDYSFSLRHHTDNGGTKAETSNFNFKAGYWYHMAVVLDRNTAGNRKLAVYVNGASIPVDVTGWIDDVYAWSNSGKSPSPGNVGTATGNNLGNIIYVGSTAAFRASFDGYLDEFQIWNKALTADEVKTAMWHFDQIPAGLIGYWDFEQDPASDRHLLSTGTLSGLTGFVTSDWSYGDKTNPNTNQTNMDVPVIGAGSPFLAGSYAITTTPSWKYTGSPTNQGAVVGNDVAGSTSVSYNQEGEYTATLTLSNSWGKDSKSVQLYVIDGTVDLQGNVIENMSVYPNPFAEAVHIQFANAGEYELEVLTLEGRLIKSAALQAIPGQVSRVTVEGESGTYLVRIKQQGKIVQTLKLVKK